MPACAKIRIFLENSNQYSTQLLSSTMSFQGKNVQWTNNVQWCTWFTFWCKLLILLWMVTDQLLCIVMLYSFLGFFSFVFFLAFQNSIQDPVVISLWFPLSQNNSELLSFIIWILSTDIFLRNQGNPNPQRICLVVSSYLDLDHTFFFFFWAEKLKTITSFSAHHRGT